MSDLLKNKTYSDFDPETALQAMGGDRLLLKELAGIFLEEYPELLLALRQAVLLRDRKGIESNAHKLKGSLTHFGARTAAVSASLLEKSAKEDNFEGVEDALQRFETSLDSFLAELRSFHA